MAEISVPWGEGRLSVQLPAGWPVQQTASPAIPPAPADWPQHLARSLAHPEGAPPLGKLLAARRNGKIAIIVEDLTRHSPLPSILQTVFRELDHAKIPRENVEIFFAAGMHPPPSAEQVAEKIGPELAAEVPWRANPWRDRDAYVNLGMVQDGSAAVDLFFAPITSSS